MMDEPDSTNRSKTGTLYGVSVGVGDPELITLKAKRIIEQCSIIATPITHRNNTLALAIAQGATDLTDKTILKLPFIMNRDELALSENRDRQARTIADELDEGHDVAMLNLGDISVFSTFSYIQDRLKDSYHVEVIPGVTSFSAAAARLNVSLTDPDLPLHIIPASGMPLDDVLDLPGYKVLMKSASQLPQVIEKLTEKGLDTKSGLVQNCGLENEGVYSDIHDPNIDGSYFTTIIVRG